MLHVTKNCLSTQNAKIGESSKSINRDFDEAEVKIEFLHKLNFCSVVKYIKNLFDVFMFALKMVVNIFCKE